MINLHRAGSGLRGASAASGLLAILLLAGIWVNIGFAAENPGGIDFLIPWKSAELFINEGISPYSAQTTDAIQQRIYGRSADIEAGESRQAFNYPFYAYLLFLPFGLIDNFDLARGLWMSILMLSMALGGLLAPSLVEWRAGPWTRVAAAIFAVVWYFGARTIIVGQVSAIVVLFLIIGLTLIRNKQDVPAGVFLALATIKPQISLLLIVFVLIWAISRQRSGAVLGFLVSLGFLLASSMLVISDWPLQFLQQLVHPDFVLSASPLGLVAAAFPGIESLVNGVLHIVAILYLFSEWYLALGKDARWFTWTAMQTVVITALVMPGPSTSNAVVFVPVLLMIFRIWQQRWGRFGIMMIGVSGLILAIGVWALFLNTVTNAIESPLLFYPVPLFCLFALWWVRWWALRPAKLMLEDFADIMA